mgnify:CR=1 FL=1
MFIYYETKVKDLELTKQIFDRFWDCEKVEIQHYKNLFDTKIWDYTTEPFIILAKQDHITLLPTPPNYWFPWKSFFFRPSLNCFFRCKYCYLQWTFRNRFPVFFLNYEDMQNAILEKINSERNKWFEWQLTFYASNYADLLATEDISHFHSSFLPFCETLPDNVLIETRTKSCNIWYLLTYAQSLEKENKTPTQNMEIAFSLSPRKIAQEYELWTASLDEKIDSINQLINKWFRVWLRFLPLLPVDNFETIYTEFLKEITDKLDINKVASIAISPIIFNEWDYWIIKEKYANNQEFPIINNLQKNEHQLWTCSDKEINSFNDIFSKAFPNKTLLRDYK